LENNAESQLVGEKLKYGTGELVKEPISTLIRFTSR